MDPLTAIGLVSAVGNVGAKLFANKKLKDAQEAATEAQKRAQAQYRSDFNVYEAGINSKLRDAPQRNINNTLINQVVGQAQGNLYASQGRAAGTEARLDAIRQGTSDQAYRASQVARTPMDLLGAIGQISANESSLVSRVEGNAARERVSRIDSNQRNLQRAIESKARFRQSADNLMFNDKITQYNNQLQFQQEAGYNKINTELGFAQGNIQQQAANAQANSASISGIGTAMGNLSGTLMSAGTANQQMANDLAIAGMGQSTPLSLQEVMNDSTIVNSDFLPPIGSSGEQGMRNSNYSFTG